MEVSEFVLLGTTLCQVTRGGVWGGVGARGGRVGGTYIRGSTYLQAQNGFAFWHIT